MAFWFEPVPFFQHPAAKVFAQFRECLQNCHQARFPMPPTPTQLVSSVASFPATLIFRTLLRPPYPIFTSPVLQQKTFYSLAVSPPCCGYTSVYIYIHIHTERKNTDSNLTNYINPAVLRLSMFFCCAQDSRAQAGADGKPKRFQERTLQRVGKLAVTGNCEPFGSATVQ